MNWKNTIFVFVGVYFQAFYKHEGGRKLLTKMNKL